MCGDVIANPTLQLTDSGGDRQSFSILVRFAGSFPGYGTQLSAAGAEAANYLRNSVTHAHYVPMADVLTKLRSTTSAMLLADFALEQGIGLEKLLPETGIREGDLRDPEAEITGAQELTSVRNLVREADNQPGLGLLAGRRSHATAHGVWGFAVLTVRMCATLSPPRSVTPISHFLSRGWNCEMTVASMTLS